METIENIGNIVLFLSVIGLILGGIFIVRAVKNQNTENRKKHLHRLCISALCAVCGITAVTISADRTPPEISAVAMRMRPDIEYGQEVAVDDIAAAKDDRSDDVTLTIARVSTAHCTISDDQSSVIFDAPGNYTVTVQAVDENDNEAEEKVSVSVLDLTAPAFIDTTQNHEVEYGATVSLTHNKTSGNDLYVKAEDDITDVSYEILDVKAETPDSEDKGFSVNEGEITFDQPGEYQILISAQDEYGNTATTEKTVSVVDKTAPELKGVSSKLTIKDTDEKINSLKGITAKDEIDGDLTEQISVDTSDVSFGVPGEYSVTYTVKDESGNKTEKSVPVVIKDTTSPAIVLSQTSFSLTAGDSVPDYGSSVSVSDKGDSSPTIVVDDTAVDYNTPGTYNIAYTATDSSGNSATQAATVTVKAAPQVQASVSSAFSSGSGSGGGTVYITETGSKYHRAGCQYLKYSQIAIDKSSAISQGYDACSRCNP